MRLLICLLLAVTGWTQTGMMRVQRRAAGGGGAPAFVQYAIASGFGGTGTVTSGAWSGSGTVGVGSTIVGMIWGGVAAGATATDSCGNSVSYLDQGNFVRTFWFHVATGGACALTIGWAGGTTQDVMLVAHEISGGNAVAPIGAVHSMGSGTYDTYGAADSMVGALVTAASNSLCSAFYVTNNVGGSHVTPGTSWTGGGYLLYSGFYGFLGEYRSGLTGAITAVAQDANSVADLTYQAGTICVQP